MIKYVEESIVRAKKTDEGTTSALNMEVEQLVKQLKSLFHAGIM